LRQNISTWLAGIVLLVVVASLINFWPNANLGIIGINKSFPIVLGLDLQGGSQVVFQAQPQPGQDPSVVAGNIQAARDVIENRAAGAGVSEPLVQVQGSNRILVELPGVKNPEDVLKTLRETGYLEFIDAGTTALPEGTLVTTSQNGTISGPTPAQVRAYLQGGGTNGATTPVTPTTTISNTGTTTGTVGTTDNSDIANFKTYNNGQVFPVVVTGAEIDGTKVQASIDQTGKPAVQFTLKGDGPNKLATYTQNNIGKYMPIVLDKKVISSPVIQGAIPNGQGEINNMTSSEAQSLAIQLRYGALPVGLEQVSQRTVGPTLGAEGIQRSLVAGIVGLGLVMLFMLFFYRLPGLLADVALLIFSLITFAVFRFIPVTLTLAGIAGFILSIGMAVDANVLIFARLKEELRSGKTLGAAVEAGFDHAWPSIRDSNMTTVIVTLILYWFGNFFGASVIKGFALTLFISVLVSLFTAVTVSRTFLRLVVGLRLAQNQWWFGLDRAKPQAPPPPAGGTQPVA
jgi:preprotein translocase subunit SecD